MRLLSQRRPAPFIASTISNSTSACYGGSGNQTTNGAEIGLLSFPLQQGTGFFYGTYKITPDIQASLMLNYGYNRSHSSSLIVDSSATIKTDNAYLNPTLLAAMKGDGLTSITVSVNGTDGFNITHPTDIADFANASWPAGHPDGAAILSRGLHPGWGDRRQLVVERLLPAQRKPRLRSLSSRSSSTVTSPMRLMR